MGEIIEPDEEVRLYKQEIMAEYTSMITARGKGDKSIENIHEDHMNLWLREYYCFLGKQLIGLGL